MTLAELAITIALLGGLGLVASRFGLSAIPAYLLAGILRALGSLLLIAPLLYLFRAVEARSPRVRSQLIGVWQSSHCPPIMPRWASSLEWQSSQRLPPEDSGVRLVPWQSSQASREWVPSSG